MDSILLPTDFSETSVNAARYALQLAGQLGVPKLVLYHSYEIPLTIDPITPTMQMLDLESLKAESAKKLSAFEDQIRSFAGNITVASLHEYGALAAGMDDVCKKVNAGFVVMGITGGNLLEEKLIGSNALTVAKHTAVPVIIVPPQTSFTKINTIMLTGELGKEDTTIPLEPIRLILTATKAKLLVLNVDDKDTTINENTTRQLAELNPVYHFSKSKHYADEVHTFAVNHNVDLAVTLLRKHGFFESLFSGDHTRTLAFHGQLPLMVV